MRDTSVRRQAKLLPGVNLLDGGKGGCGSSKRQVTVVLYQMYDKGLLREIEAEIKEPSNPKVISQLGKQRASRS